MKILDTLSLALFCAAASAQTIAVFPDDYAAVPEGPFNPPSCQSPGEPRAFSACTTWSFSAFLPTIKSPDLASAKTARQRKLISASRCN
ncbi:MAG: hypothetical protein ACI89X_002618 [Planctomycetota bacterium]|jgi:hypothetical protein